MKRYIHTFAGIQRVSYENQILHMNKQQTKIKILTGDILPKGFHEAELFKEDSIKTIINDPFPKDIQGDEQYG